ncbi:MFS transporter [Brevibacillus humidisoli]|uniref:MFS transporter n=1 Tax=Brevibacillus humidisoli TaxID=2895522 RepID=UPI001E3BF781|nr:MFS transporter [Brevibacillus humidisoli]UFJ39287.1 MFS transporter [Brevibacillus humidisoli]
MDAALQKRIGEKLMYIVMFTLALSAMSVLMFNLVLPQISEEFLLNNAQVSWVTSAYALIYGIGTVVYGKLADRYKLKDLLTFGVILFALGSLLGLAAQTFWMVLLGRCMQAVGAASIPASAMLIPLRYFPPERRGSAMGTAFVGLALGSALGPVLSALILSVMHWRWLFGIPLFILLTLPFYRRYLGDDQGSPGKMDWLGGSLLAAAVTLLLLSVTYETIWFALGGLVSLLLFIARIHLTSFPFFPPGLFKNKTYTLGLIITFLISGIGFSLYFLSPLLLAHVNVLPASWIGFALVPGAAASAILGRKGGKLADSKGNSYLFFLASGLLFSCFILLSTFTGIAAAYIAIFLILGNVGQTFMMIAMSNSVSRTLTKEQSGVGMGLLSMMNFIAGGIATGIYGKLVDFDQVTHWNPANMYSAGAIYSNIFLVLAILHALILLVYQYYFRRSWRD